MSKYDPEYKVSLSYHFIDYGSIFFVIFGGGVMNIKLIYVHRIAFFLILLNISHIRFRSLSEVTQKHVGSVRK